MRHLTTLIIYYTYPIPSNRFDRPCNIDKYTNSSIIALHNLRKLKQEGRDEKGSVVFSISDELGIAFAKQSILQFFLDRWGLIIGAKSLAALSTKNLAPDVTWSTLQQECSRSPSG